MDGSIAGHQQRFNRDTRGRWDDYSGHRRRTTRLVSALAGSEASRLCVLGAGNLNDLDLAALGGRFAEFHLVDLDGAAMQDGVRRQGAVDVTHHPGVDLSLCLPALETWRAGASTDDGAVDAFLAGLAAAPAPDLGGPFDVVASTCIVSQLLDAVAHSLGTAHPRAVEVALAVRDRHLRLLGELTAPGGRALLVTDTLSDREDPAVAAAPPRELPALLLRAQRERRCYLGTDRDGLLAAIRRLDGLGGRASCRALRPWRWRMGGRVFLVGAVSITFSRG